MKKLIVFILCLFFYEVVRAQDKADSVKVDTLSAAVVRTDKQRRAARTQTSLQRLDAQKLKGGFAVLGSPDLIKTLQTLPGVSAGAELFSGLYVRGGDGSDNLFLLDGVPLYQVNHLGGLFSSFNTDMVEEVDFYKGGFPARYGGRLSSVVDVDVKGGNFTKWKGTASIGLVDGRFQIEGPIIKNKTSLNFGVRRTWMDIAKTLAMPIIRSVADDADMAEDLATNFHYDFGDYNLKLVHLLSPTSKLSLSLYYGQDYLNAKGVSESKSQSGLRDSYTLKSNMIWGNMLGTLRWDKTWEEKGLAMDSRIYYTRYRSDIGANLNVYDEGENEETEQVEVMEGSLSEKDYTRIHDIGISSDWFYDAVDGHHMRFGIDGITHIYDPYRKADMTMIVNGIPYVQENPSTYVHYLGGEISLYYEDEITLWDWLNVNLGLRDALFMVKERSYNRLEPRLALKASLTPHLDLKASYAKMDQFSHIVSTCYIDLPTSLWMPSTASVKPMSSDQVVIGATYKFNDNWMVDVEGFYKKMDHLYEYNGTFTLLPSLEKWELDYVEGRGRAYGVEFSTEYVSKKLQASAYYTLSKNERYFSSYYYTWFPDRNDNTHKINLGLSYRFSPKFEVYASWIYHTGNRFTGASMTVWEENNIVDIYDKPNNYRLPSYHRMDVGLNWHRKLSSGRIRTLNLSIYNVYCRLNAFLGAVDNSENKAMGVAYGIIPIIPTFSYSWKF